jgi:phosphoribosyl-dephospho-CoA transferase
VPLPPDAAGVKVRVPLRVSSALVARATPAITLREALPVSGDWHDKLAALCDAAPTLRVFGSLAMQTLTGQQYVSPTSDVDLLFHPSSRSQLENVMSLLTTHAEHLPLDGELVFPDGAAVSWKEWRMAITHPAKVMVKELHTVRLADTTSLLATLEAS